MITYSITLVMALTACPAPVLTFLNGTTPEAKHDRFALVNATQGCNRTFGENACVVRVEKIRMPPNRHYHVTCTRGEEQDE